MWLIQLLLAALGVGAGVASPGVRLWADFKNWLCYLNIEWEEGGEGFKILVRLWTAFLPLCLLSPEWDCISTQDYFLSLYFSNSI